MLNWVLLGLKILPFLFLSTVMGLLRVTLSMVVTDLDLTAYCLLYHSLRYPPLTYRDTHSPVSNVLDVNLMLAQLQLCLLLDATFHHMANDSTWY